jgi:hypothetical protein
MALFIKKKKKSLKNGTQMFNGIPWNFELYPRINWKKCNPTVNTWFVKSKFKLSVLEMT